MNTKTLGLSVLSALFALGLTARADDKVAEANLVQATQLYAQRTDAAKVEQGLRLLKAAETEATTNELKYDVCVLTSKFLYWKGMHTAGDNNKMVIHNEGVNKANQARTLLPAFADANYWSAANLGRWAEAKGVIASLSKKQEIMDTLNSIFTKTVKPGKPDQVPAQGKTYEGYGADRILGRLYFKLPGFAGGSLAKSLTHGDRSYAGAPTVAINTNFYAESLASGNATQKATAKRILDELLAKDPNTLNPDRLPETIEEFADARKLRAQLGN